MLKTSTPSKNTSQCLTRSKTFTSLHKNKTTVNTLQTAPSITASSKPISKKNFKPICTKPILTTPSKKPKPFTNSKQNYNSNNITKDEIEITKFQTLPTTSTTIESNNDKAKQKNTLPLLRIKTISTRSIDITNDNTYISKSTRKPTKTTNPKLSRSKSAYCTPRSISKSFYLSTSLYIEPKPKENKFYYLIKPENCGYLVKNCFANRSNWFEISLKRRTLSLKSKKALQEIQKQKAEEPTFNFRWQETIRGIDFGSLSKCPTHMQMVNHFEFHSTISNKTNLFINLLRYAEWNDINIFKYIPMTIILNYNDPKFITRFDSFTHLYNKISDYVLDIDSINLTKNIKGMFYKDFFSFPDKLGSRTPMCIPNTHYQGSNLWLIKAPDLNRGRCIKIVKSTKLIKYYIKCFHSGIDKGYLNSNNNSNKKTPKTISDVYNLYRGNHVIVQKYIEQPMLYRGRKFDIRIWVLLTHKMEVYYFKEGHLKICSVNYSLKSSDAYVHLTNYSFQKYNQNFSKFEEGNEASFQDLQKYLEEKWKLNNNEERFNIYDKIIPKIKEIIEIVFRCVKYRINKYKRKYCFEIFGFDFMLDKNGNPFLIEVNSNPGLEESSPLIKMLVPRMIDDALRLTLDKIFENKFTYYNEDKGMTFDEFQYSKFEVNNYSNKENMWEYICSIQD